MFIYIMYSYDWGVKDIFSLLQTLPLHIRKVRSFAEICLIMTFSETAVMFAGDLFYRWILLSCRVSIIIFILISVLLQTDGCVKRQEERLSEWVIICGLDVGAGICSVTSCCRCELGVRWWRRVNLFTLFLFSNELRRPSVRQRFLSVTCDPDVGSIRRQSSSDFTSSPLLWLGERGGYNETPPVDQRLCCKNASKLIRKRNKSVQKVWKRHVSSSLWFCSLRNVKFS